ncbi:MAG: hypothetical protein ACSHXF_10995 [Aquaticitalea sp.]
MKKSIYIIIFILSTQLINAQSNCSIIRKNIRAYESLIKSYDKDSMAYLKETAQYSSKEDNESKEKYKTAKAFLATVAKDKATALDNIKKLENQLLNCKD